MTVAVTKTAIDGSKYVVTVAGTAAEINAELAAGTAATAGYEWNGAKSSIIASGGNATAGFVIYIAEKFTAPS